MVGTSNIAGWVDGFPMPRLAPRLADGCFHGRLVAGKSVVGPTGILNHYTRRDSRKRLHRSRWPFSLRNIIIKTPLLAAEGFLILEIQIQGQILV
ncbi:hypothetical protein [Novosphingobium sp. B-7]|jgi:hypothetical protein|uniref:hypothetical protein n=1 Tax=Novosphingobium sp. B-7 TaxID=1298855 RepID=UPI00192C5C78|nr:hypothetical protein [Novosphingobium sp. B-7]